MFVIVTESSPLSVVSEIPVPATKVKVSVLVSAVTLFCPDTAIVWKEFCPEPPGMFIVFIAPVPDAVTPAPVKFNVVAEELRLTDSS